MSTDNKIWFSAGELALLGERFVAGLPGTMRGCTRMAQRKKWVLREVKGSGGPGGIRTEYQPPAAVLELIYSFLAENPDFFTKSKTRTKADLAKLSKEVFGDAPQRLRQQHAQYGSASEALLNPQPEGRMLMLQMVLRISEDRLKEPPTPDVAKKIVDLADAWLPYCEQHPEMRQRLTVLKATAALFI